MLDVHWGLSPRTRGSRADAARRRLADGSIPANAGKPPLAPASGCRTGVYPRERGEAAFPRLTYGRVRGLSPRTRGSRHTDARSSRPNGSIPANAGKPTAAAPCRPRGGVYPRERGEAAAMRTDCLDTQGLSPRTRGSPRERLGRDVDDGSIPANAGKPNATRRAGRGIRVYPRERGEAWPRRSWAVVAQGLSPRTRGSQTARRRARHRLGSIPANAGKPLTLPRTRMAFGVYPRERGEAKLQDAGQDTGLGLSPRTRGSPRWPSPSA